MLGLKVCTTTPGPGEKILDGLHTSLDSKMEIRDICKGNSRRLIDRLNVTVL